MVERGGQRGRLPRVGLRDGQNPGRRDIRRPDHALVHLQGKRQEDLRDRHLQSRDHRWRPVLEQPHRGRAGDR